MSSLVLNTIIGLAGILGTLLAALLTVRSQNRQARWVAYFNERCLRYHEFFTAFAAYSADDADHHKYAALFIAIPAAQLVATAKTRQLLEAFGELLSKAVHEDLYALDGYKEVSCELVASMRQDLKEKERVSPWKRMGAND